MTALEMDPNVEVTPWEAQALSRRYPLVGTTTGRALVPAGSDPLIWAGLYSRTGLDVMMMLVLVATRPDPKVDIGPVDCGVSLVVCARGLTDAPIIYVSEGFTELTGYVEAEVLGQNCRFLQHPPGVSVDTPGDAARMAMKRAVAAGDEVQLSIVNYRKDGTPFMNLVTIVPITYQGVEYFVGFHAAV